MPLLLGKKFPHGYSAANAGVIILDIQAVLDVYYAVADGKPLIEKTMALHQAIPLENVEDVIEIDQWARRTAEHKAKELNGAT